MVLAVTLTVFGTLWGCEETTPPAPPPPPPQATFEVYNMTATDSMFLLESNQVHDVFVDSSDRIWFSTDQGVSMKDGTNNIVTYDDFDGIPNRFCRAVGEFEGKIYVGTWGGGAAVFEDTIWVPLPVHFSGDTGLVDLRVAAIASDSTAIWFGTVNGLSRFDPNRATNAQRWSNQTHKMGFSRVVSGMHFEAGTTRGNELWITTKDGGVTVIRPTITIRYTAGTTGLPENDLNGVAYSPTTGLFWVAGASTGFASVDVDSATWGGLGTLQGLASNLGTGVAIRDMGGTEEMWVSTQTGLSVVIGSAVTNYIAGSGLPADRIRSVVADRNGEIWACFIDQGVGRVLEYELPSK